jgi:alpha-L-rhamnosidase
MKLLAVIAFLFIATTLSNAQSNFNLPVNLRCDFLENPSGIDVTNPALSWNIQAKNPKVRGIRQSAYQILVATSPDLLRIDEGSQWNSGKVLSDLMGQVQYEGKPLQSSQKYWWKVKIWDEKGNISDWSPPSHWTMGILNNDEWKAKWISAAGAEKYARKYKSAGTDFSLKQNITEFRANKTAPDDPNYSSMLLRKEFEVKPKLERAVVHVCGLGHYELTINGSKVGDYLLAPGWSDYRKTVLYDTYDVTQQIKSGKNAIGLILSNGMYNIQPDSVRYVKFLNSYGQLKAKVQLQCEYSDGSVQIFGTDNSWQVSPGPVTYMNEFGGEDFDARLVQIGWDQPSFKADNRWHRAIELPDNDAILKGLSCSASPIKAIETKLPIKISKIKPNCWVYDLGQNASIMPEIIVKGKIGSYVRLIPSELLKPDGTVDRASATQDGVRPAWWQYTLATSGSENYFPKFFYQGGRYLQAELFPAEGDTTLPVIEKLKGIVVHSSATPIGTFSCSNELFNRIYSLVRWAQRSNLMSTITDCPHREKMSWLEQYHLNGPSLRYNFDLTKVFRKSMNDMTDGQWDNGLIPNIAPGYFYAGQQNITNGFFNSPEWGSSFIIVPWQQYLFSGDISLMKRYFENMKRYIDFLDQNAQDNILKFGLGDWYDIGPKPAWGSQLTPESFTATAIYFYDNKVMAQMAKAIGKTDDAKKFELKAEAIRQSFNKEFYTPEKGKYSTGSNTTYAIPLAMEIAEPKNRKSLVDSLVYDIRKRGNSFTSGEVGYKFLLKALAMEGYSNVIFDMNNQSDKPGYGYQLKMGATSLTEKWDAGVGSFGSQNHFMSGQIMEWFYNDLAGIGVDPEGAGFLKSIIKPMVVGDIKWVNGSYQTVSGLISTEWKREGNQFSLDVSIPVNTSATVFIPTEKENDVTESGKQTGKAEGVRFLRMENGKAIYEIGSGNYHFVSKIANSKN